MAFITSDSSGKRVVVPALENADYTYGVTYIKNNHGVIAVQKGKESEYTYTIGSAGLNATPKYPGIVDDNNNVAVEINNEPNQPVFQVTVPQKLFQDTMINGRKLAGHDDGVNRLTGQAYINTSLMGGDDFLEVVGGSNNFANGNKGSDHIVLRGGQGRYLGGADSDTMEVFDSITGTLVNGNKGNDVVKGNAAGVAYRGGADNDILAVSQGNAWGDKGADTFRGVGGDGFVTVEDYTSGEDMVQLGMGGSWSQFGNRQMFTNTDGDQIMLLAGISSADQVTLV